MLDIFLNALKYLQGVHKVPITFSGLTATLAATYKGGKIATEIFKDSSLQKDFKVYLKNIETRRVLYVEWQYEKIYAVQSSLSEILELTREFRAVHADNRDIDKLFRGLVTTLQEQQDVIYGCNMRSRQGEFMAYKALLKIRTEFAKVLAITCGILNVNPKSTELSEFIMNMAVVKPTIPSRG